MREGGDAGGRIASEDPLSTPANVRDLGGLPLVDGGVTRNGVLLRGDALYDGDGAPAHVAWPPATVIDLRSSAERARAPYAWPAGTRVLARELLDAADPGALPSRTALVEIYREMLVKAGPGIADILDLMPEDGATYVHCAAGKDRTGVSIAALLLLAGVPIEDVVADYQATGPNMGVVIERMLDRGAVQPGYDPATAAAPVAPITFIVEEVTAPPGGPREWFLRQGATDGAVDRYLARIRS